MAFNAKKFGAIFIVTAACVMPFYRLQAQPCAASLSLYKEKERTFAESNIRFATAQAKEMIRALDSSEWLRHFFISEKRMYFCSYK
jgi:hypothetical protein